MSSVKIFAALVLSLPALLAFALFAAYMMILLLTGILRNNAVRDRLAPDGLGYLQ